MNPGRHTNSPPLHKKWPNRSSLGRQELSVGQLDTSSGHVTRTPSGKVANPLAPVI